MNTSTVKLFQTTPIGEMVFTMGKKYVVKETSPDHRCGLCAFNELSIKCPFFSQTKTIINEEGQKVKLSEMKQSAIKPVCFANQRPDRKSVYYVVEDLVWTNPGKKHNAIL